MLSRVAITITLSRASKNSREFLVMEPEYTRQALIQLLVMIQADKSDSITRDKIKLLIYLRLNHTRYLFQQKALSYITAIYL